MLNFDKLIRGAIEMHVHVGPEARPRRFDALQTAINARDAGMRAIVIKNSVPTAAIAQLVNRLVNGITVFGSVTLDPPAGGLDPFVLETAAQLGAKMVWLPTKWSTNSLSKAIKFLKMDLKAEDGISLLDAGGDLVPEIRAILEIAKKYDMVVGSGHISPTEVFKVVAYARQIGLNRLVVTHVSDRNVNEETLDIKSQQRLAEQGVFMEHCYLGMMPGEGSEDPEYVIRQIREVGLEHCILSTDFGQAHHPPAVDGLRLFFGLLLKNGFTETEIERMSKTNPAKLLGLD